MSIALIFLEKVTRSFPLWIALIVVVAIPFLLIAMLWASVSHRRAKERLYVLQLAIEKQLFEEEANDEMFPKTLLNSTDSKSKE
ncbi:MAG: hypothetical protein LBG61_03890 [Burkholderiales bacterium]|nr:hypothetical protein [Burkholderiales bacterium]